MAEAASNGRTTMEDGAGGIPGEDVTMHTLRHTH